MHKKIAHILRRNSEQKMPKWVIFFDTETYDEIIDDKTKRLKLKLGYAILTRRARDNTFRTVSEVVFYRVDELYAWLTGILRGRERYYITAHNVGFDLRVCAILDYLAVASWERTLLIDEGINFIARYRKGDTTVRIINNQQLFNCSLKTLGESIGTYKQQVDFASVTDEALLEYCKQDVEVMRQAWNVWLKFIYENNLGNFQITSASQAMSAFRHRFMSRSIFIHDNEKAIALERESYHGGRVECFYIGRFERGQVYCLDVNSMYPYVMKHREVPTKLLKYYAHPTRRLFETLRGHYGYVVDATLTVTQPSLPVVADGKLLFPTGTIRGVFTKPELENVASSAVVSEVHRLAVYETHIIFNEYVNFFYEARQKFKAEGNIAFTYIAKLLLNSLYGKFAQRNSVYRTIGKSKTLKDGIYLSSVAGYEGLRKLRVINGVVEISDGHKEGFNSFVAIASYITAEARVYLNSLVLKAGRENVLYCDTDSLFVTEAGYERLNEYIDPATLGALKVEGVNFGITIRAPKFYQFGEKAVSKGIRANAVRIAEGTFEQDKFMSFTGALRAHELDGVIVSRVVKHLRPNYRKGTILPSGFVEPLRF